MAYKDWYYNLIINLKNIPGWHISRKLVIIECDDWGGIRYPTKEVYDRLQKAGIRLAEGFMRYDTLESAEDLEALFNVLSNVKDLSGKSAIMSPLTNMANPDFKKIRASGFREYHYERFTDTLIRYGRGSEVLNIWKQGINAGIFIPQYHGREHISVHFWLEKLREGVKELLIAFDNEVVSVEIPGVKKFLQGFRPEFYFNSEEQKYFIRTALSDGTLLFHDIFGYKPTVFVPSDGIFHPDFNNTLSECGLKFVNVNHLSLIPDGNGGLKYKICRAGERANSGLRYYIRNCAFEPSSESYKGISHTLKQMEAGFRWRKPAIISTHRANFVGGISVENRDRSLRELQKLLSAVVNRWPDVEFMGSEEALNIMNETNN